MDELTAAMSIPDLKSMREQYKDNPDIVRMLDAALIARATEELEAKNKAKFEAKMLGLAKLPEPPTGIHNVHLRWAEVEVDDTTQEPEDVEVVVKPSEADGNGNIIKAAVTKTEKRYPQTKVFQWVVETNKGFSGTTAAKAKSKRAVLVHKRVGNTLEPVGKFSNQTKAAEYLKLEVGTDSAKRKLEAAGYIVDPADNTGNLIS